MQNVGLKLKDLLGPSHQESLAVISNKKNNSIWEKLQEIGTIKPEEIVEFTRHLTVMLGAGVTIFEAVNFLKDQSKNKVFAIKLKHVIEDLNNGESLSGAMKKHPKVFPEIYTNIIQVGEKSGTLAQTMMDLANHLEESERFKNKVKSALIYPKIILSVMSTFVIVLFYFVMPKILKIFDSLNADIPLSTRVVMRITGVFQHHILLIISIFPLIFIGTKLLLKNKKIRRNRDLFYIHMPFVGRIVLNYNTAQVSQHFGTLFESGLTIPKCLEITQSVIKNVIFKEELDYMVEKIKNGASFSSSFQEETEFPPMFVKLIKVGERTGKLPHVISYMKGYYKELVDNDVKNISSIIEPLIMVLLGLMVAALVMTVIGPIYQLISHIGPQ